MAESETLEVTLKKPMGIVLEENVSGFGGLRVKEVTAGGSAEVAFLAFLVSCFFFLFLFCLCVCSCHGFVFPPYSNASEEIRKSSVILSKSERSQRLMP